MPPRRALYSWPPGMGIGAGNVLRLLATGFLIIANGINLLVFFAERVGAPELSTPYLMAVVALLSGGHQLEALIVRATFSA